MKVITVGAKRRTSSLINEFADCLQAYAISARPGHSALTTPNGNAPSPEATSSLVQTLEGQAHPKDLPIPAAAVASSAEFFATFTCVTTRSELKHRLSNRDESSRPFARCWPASRPAPTSTLRRSSGIPSSPAFSSSIPPAPSFYGRKKDAPGSQVAIRFWAFSTPWSMVHS